MKLFKILGIVLLVALYSCEKQKDVTIDKILEEGAGNFAPMAVGNYWVYDVSWIDSLGNVDFLNWDSTYISGDTSLNGNVYYIYKTSSSALFIQLLRDSASYIVDESGEVFFSSTNFTDKLFEDAFINGSGDTTIYTYRKMFKPPGPTPCMAGVFDALDAEMFRTFTFSGKKMDAHAFYAPGVGLIMRSDFPLFSGKRKVYNLHHYHIE